MKQWRETAVYFAVGIGVLFVLTTFVGWKEILVSLQQANPEFVLYGFLAGTSMIVLYAVNWHIVLQEVGYDLGVFRLVKIFYAGNFANNVTPMGQVGGEPFIAYILSKNTPIPYEKSFAGVLSADIINSLPFFTLSISGLTYFLLFEPTDFLVTLIAFFILAVAIVILGFLAMVWYSKDFATTVIVRLGTGLRGLSEWSGLGRDWFKEYIDEDEIIERMDTFYGTLHSVFSDREALIESMIVTHVAGLMGVLALYSFLLAVGWKTSFFLLLLINPATVVAFFLPLPGGLGGIEVVLVTLLVIIAGIPPATASAAVVLYRATAYAIPLVIGGLVLWRFSMSLTETTEAVAKKDPSPTV